MTTILNEAKRRVVLYDDTGANVGEIEYLRNGDHELYATRTEVNPGSEGKGYAGMLLDALVEFAKANGAKIVPQCDYVSAAFEKNPEKYAEVIKH